MIIISIFIFLYYSPIISLMIIISTILIGFYLKYISTLMDKRWQNYLDKLHKFEKTLCFQKQLMLARELALRCLGKHSVL